MLALFLPILQGSMALFSLPVVLLWLITGCRLRRSRWNLEHSRGWLSGGRPCTAPWEPCPVQAQAQPCPLFAGVVERRQTRWHLHAHRNEDGTVISWATHVC